MASAACNNQTSLLKGKSVDYKSIASGEDESSDTDYSSEEENCRSVDTEPLTVRTVLELLTCVLAFASRGLCMNGIGPTLLDLRSIASISLTQSAWIFVSQSVGFLVGCVPVKAILSRYNTELVTAVFLLMRAVCSALTAQFHSLTIMCLMLFGQGFALTITGLGVMSMCLQIGGTSRSAMFLQCIYLGISVGSVLGPFIARPFLSPVSAKNMDNHVVVPGELSIGTHNVNSYGINESSTAGEMATFIGSSQNVTKSLDSVSNVETYYLLQGASSALPAILFIILFLSSDKSVRNEKDDSPTTVQNSKQQMALLTAVVVGMFFIGLVYFGVVEMYNNLLTTFAVLGPLHLLKSQGVYITSTFWASMCFGRLNGIWIARLVSPFKLLMTDMLLAAVAAVALLILADKSVLALWGLTIMLGLSFSTLNGSMVSWMTQDLPDKNGIMTVTMVARCFGLLILPSTVTLLIKTCGTMSIMYCLVISTAIMPVALAFTSMLLKCYVTNSSLSKDVEYSSETKCTTGHT